MAGQHHETVEAEALTPPSDRSTGIVFAVVAGIVAVLFRGDHLVAGIAGAVAAGFGLVSWLKPALLHPLTIGWFRFGLLLNRVMSPLVMGVLYFGVMVPFGLAMQLVRDPMRRKRPTGRTYWVQRDKSLPESSMRNQF